MPCCKFQLEMSEAVKTFLQKQPMRSEVGIYIMEDWNEDDPNFVEMSTHRPLCCILQALNYACILHGTIVLDLFLSFQTQGRCSPFFPLHAVLAGGFRPGAPNHPRHPKAARPRPCTAELLQGAKRNSVRIIRRRSPP